MVSSALQYKLLQVPLDDHVLNGTHCNLEKVRVGGISKVAINLLLRIPVQCPELVHEVFACQLPVVWRPMVVGEAMIRYRAPFELLFEEIHFVEEEDQS